MIPTTLYRATSAKASVKSRLQAVTRSTSVDLTGFGRVVTVRETKRASTVAPATRKAPSFAQVIASGGLTLKQAERLMADATTLPEVDDHAIVYQRPQVALQQVSVAVLCVTLAVIGLTFLTLMVS